MKGPLCDFVTIVAENGQTVGVVGSGLCVSTVKAANEVGDGGRVISFEASKHWFENASETVRLSLVEHIVELKHEIFRSANNVFKGTGDTSKVSQKEYLRQCDILELDCEGAELGIIQLMSERPTTIIVETHGFLESSIADVTALLTEHGYDIVDKKPENLENDVMVLRAELSS